MSSPSTSTLSAANQKSVMSEFPEATNSKRCTKCVRRLPLSAFRRLRTGREARHPECNQCRNLRESALVASKRRTARRHELLDRLERLKAMRSKRRYMALLEDTIDRFRGPQKLADTFLAEFESAKERGDHRTAGKLLVAIAKLIEHCPVQIPDVAEAVLRHSSEQATPPEPVPTRPAQTDLSRLSDRQLDTRHRKLSRQ